MYGVIAGMLLRGVSNQNELKKAFSKEKLNETKKTLIVLKDEITRVAAEKITKKIW